MQYQHSSNFMKALPLVKSMASTSSGQTSTHTVQPLSAMHSSSLTRTGTLLGLSAMGMVFSLNGKRFGLRRGVRGGGVLADPQSLIGLFLLLVEGDDVGLERTLETGHLAVDLLQ